MRSRPLRLALLLGVLGVRAARGGELEPLVVRCGSAAAGTRDSWGRLLPDLPFSPERGWGHAGGEAGRLESAAGVSGGEPDWEVTWREGGVKYTFRVPRGDYLVRLGFVETDVLASGLRVFDAYAEDRPVLEGIDIHAEAGAFEWLLRTFAVSVYDGWLDLRLVPVTGDRGPRISRLGIAPLEVGDAVPPAPPAPALEARGGRLQNELWWSRPEWPPLAGYGLFRSVSAEGPYESVTPEPIRIPRFQDLHVVPGETYHYKVRAYDVRGSQSPLSAAVTARAENIHQGRLKVYDLRVAAEELRRLGNRRDPPVRVPATVQFLGSRYLVDLSYGTAPWEWQARPSYLIDMSRDPYRMFRKRRELFLSAEAGDFTQMRERLASEAAAALGLAAPLVEPAVVLLGGRWAGLRHDVERLGERFRRRAGLEYRSGLLAQLAGPDLLRRDWEPCGSQVGEEGDVASLTLLVQELNRVHEGEVEGFFTDHFTSEKLIARLALGAVAGELGLEPQDLYLLRDPRFVGGKWELLRQDHRRGTWGVREFSTEVIVPAASEMEEVLFPLCVRPGRPLPEHTLVLFSRFFKSSRFRERYLERVESLLRGELAPAAFEALLDRVFAEIRDLALLEPRLWPFDHGASFLEAPARLKEAHRSRVEALREAIAAERSRPEEPVALAAFLLAPRSGPAWVELKNRSRAVVALEGYSLSESFTDPGRPLGTGGRLEPGAALRVELDRADPERRGGGTLVLWRRPGGGPRVVADFAFYGRQIEGLAYRRLDGGGSWAFVRGEDAQGGEGGGEPPAGEVVLPAYEYAHGVESSRSGDLTLWFRPSRLEEGPGAVKEVRLLYRSLEKGEAGSGPPRAPGSGSRWDSVEMVWDREKFRWSVGLEGDPSRPRTAYYFLAVTGSGGERAYPLGAPAVTLFLARLPEIRINEVCPRPGREAGAPGEFIELHNPSREPVSLRGMYLTDDRREPRKWRIAEDVVAPPGGYVVFYADGLNRGLHASFKLSNAGEYVGLYGPYEEGNLEIDGIVFRGVPPGQTWGRKQDGTKGFRLWRNPTPGKRNMPEIPEEFLKKSGGEGAPSGEAEAEPRGGGGVGVGAERDGG